MTAGTTPVHVAEVGLLSSFVLLRQLQDRQADGLAALLLANLDAVADDLLAGAVVTLTPRHLRVRPLPIRRTT